jgi:hypothetical protein
VELPSGLSFVAVDRRAVHVVLNGARLKSVASSGRRLTIVLRDAVSSVTVSIARGGLRESRALRSSAKRHKLHSLGLAVVAQNLRGTRTTIRAVLKHLGV